MNLKQLLRERRGRFMGSLLPYVGYIIQSGVAMVFLFVVIAFSAWYTSLLNNIPANVPIRWIMLALLLPSAVHSSFRTYLQSPDTIFLLPQGHRMREYFVSVWVRGIVWKTLRLAFVLITLWPLYIRTEVSPKLLWATALLVFGVKLLSSYGHWRELSMLSGAASKAYILLRWATGGLIIAAWLWQPAGRGFIFIILLALAYIAALAVPGRHAVPWEKLIMEEKNQGGRALMILGWFVDVPGREQRVYSRRYLSRWGGGIPWQRRTSYRYLLTKSFARGDIFGIVMRMALLSLLLNWWNHSSLIGTAIYLFFLFVIGIQLSSLRKLHSESFWLTVYPLPEGTRAGNTVQFVYQVLLVGACFTWLPFLAALGSRPLLVAGTLVAGVLLAYFFKTYLSRKAARLEDEDL
ncbi:ABC transporter permease [Paenibacillus wynnii]|uniref:ABC transporter permease n=1 Tax=Paenibacillus wynnii TaxID=268407 RepID=UPI00278E99B7|nr:ABC transporter permease [Paenibacillus wynnii]MDQ0196735.1 ABC-2 type transport system permease protein [Paenibacillus wynnii]